MNDTEFAILYLLMMFLASLLPYELHFAKKSMHYGSYNKRTTILPTMSTHYDRYLPVFLRKLYGFKKEKLHPAVYFHVVLCFSMAPVSILVALLGILLDLDDYSKLLTYILIGVAVMIIISYILIARAVSVENDYCKANLLMTESKRPKPQKSSKTIKEAVKDEIEHNKARKILNERLDEYKEWEYPLLRAVENMTKRRKGKEYITESSLRDLEKHLFAEYSEKLTYTVTEENRIKILTVTANFDGHKVLEIPVREE